MRTKTDMLDVASRKLAPYVLLFGCYLISYGHLSPGGGFQGGVVLASGLVLPALGCRPWRMEDLLSNRALTIGETAGFAALFLLGVVGIATTGFFLSDPFPPTARPHAWFIFLLNIAIGLKVGAGIGLLSLLIIRTPVDEPAREPGSPEGES
jgi:multicomponent Na+:H+ antiporter subunit B